MKNKLLLLSSILILTLTLKFFNFSPGNTFLNKNKPDLKPEIGNRDNPYAALEFRYNMLKGAKKYLDPLARERAVNYTRDNLLNSVLKKANTISSWTPIGPGNIGGRIRAILVRPSDSNTLLVGSVAGGIWKSTDGGISWLAKTDDKNPLSIGCMANDGDVVFAGTGEAWGNIDAAYGGGIYKSNDFGNTWSLLTSTTGSNVWNFRNILKLSFDPSGNIYAVTKAYDYKDGVGSYYSNGGLYRSTDGGSTWSNISSSMSFSDNYFNGCDVVPISSSIILFATQNNGSTLGGIFKTTNGGTNWTKISNGLPTSNYERIAFAQDPNASNTIYAVFESTLTSSHGDAGLKGIYKSTDAGSNWSALTRPPNLQSTGNLSYLATQGWYDNVIAIDPYNSNNIYVGGVDMMKSTDGGSSWSQLTYWDTYYGNPFVHADHHVIAFDPSTSNIVYSGNDGGIFKSTNGGGSWVDLNNNLAITQFYGGATYQTGTIYFGGTQDNGHLAYNGSGTSWTEMYGGDGGYAAVDQTNSNIAYEEYVYLALSKTTNGGTTWSSATTGLTDAGSGACLFIAPFSLNSENSSVLIAGSDNVWITTNSAGIWKSSSNTLSSGNSISAVTIVNSSSPYLGFAGTTDGKVFACTSLTGTNDTWANITPSGNNGAWVRRIVVDLNNKQHIYACFSGYNDDGVLPSRHIYYSSNQGGDWTDVSGDLPDVPVHSLVIDPNDSQILYIGTETGVYQSINGGTNWLNTTSGMAAYVPVDELVRQTGTNKLFAFTHGRSAFVTTSQLPVEVTDFSSNVNNGIVNLSWQTATETNNYGFDIERTVHTSEYEIQGWNKIGFLPGAGNSNSPKKYTFTDQPEGGIKFSYRLKQIDYNGNYKYYDAITVTLTESTVIRLMQNSPNPFNPSTTIKFYIPSNSRVKLKIYDMLGKEVTTLINNQTEAGYHIVYWNGKDKFGDDVSSGVYLYRLTADGFSQTKKMILVK